MILPREALVYGILLSLLGCLSSGDVADNSRQIGTDSLHTVPPDFEMVFGEGGGFTGQWTGHTIRANGAVYSWQGPVAGSNADSTGELRADSLLRIWADLQEIGFFSDSLNESGNMVAFVRVTAGNQRNRVAWIPGVEGIQPPRFPVEALYRRTRTLVNRLPK